MKYSEVVDLLVALGLDTVRTWRADKVSAVLNTAPGLKQFVPADLPVLNVTQTALLEQILGNPNNEEFSVEIDAQPVPLRAKGKKPPSKNKPSPKKENPVPKKAAAKKKESKPIPSEKTKPSTPALTAHGEPVAPYPKGFSEWGMKKKEEYWKKHSRPIPKEGAVPCLFRHLCGAGKGKTPRPLTKKDLLSLLKTELSYRETGGLESYLNTMVPGRFRDVYGVTVHKQKMESGSWGYWIEPIQKVKS
jgi:hypothetical protein